VAGITPQEILICETQARYVVQVSPEDVEEVVAAIRAKTEHVAVIGDVTSGEEEIFEYDAEVVAAVPNRPSEEVLRSLRSGE